MSKRIDETLFASWISRGYKAGQVLVVDAFRSKPYAIVFRLTNKTEGLKVTRLPHDSPLNPVKDATIQVYQEAA